MSKQINGDNIDGISIYSETNSNKLKKVKSRSYKQNISVEQTSSNRSITKLSSATSKAPVTICKKIVKLMFSNVGLIVITCLYSCVGALIFQLLEQHEELRLCEEGKGKLTQAVQSLRENLVHYVLYNASEEDFPASGIKGLNINNMTYSYRNEVSDKTENISTVEKTIDNMLKEFRDFSLKIESNYKYTGKECNESSKWKFTSAIQFCITLITTIGYGHITPKTWEGQVVCFCYAIIGIPIFAITIANLSGSFSSMFVFAYFTIEALNPFSKKKKDDDRDAKMGNQSAVASNLDLLLSQQKHKRNYSQSLNDFMLKDIINPDSKDDNSNDSDSMDSDDEEVDSNKVRIPIYLIASILILYIMIGAIAFKYFENWTLVQSIYFVTISIISIGFGDIVPGQSQDDPHGAIKFLALGFYSLFGMSIIGMCISLMQDAAKRTVHKLISKLRKCFYNKKKNTEMTEADREKERVEIINRIRMLKNYESDLNVRKRNV